MRKTVAVVAAVLALGAGAAIVWRLGYASGTKAGSTAPAVAAPGATPTAVPVPPAPPPPPVPAAEPPLPGGKTREQLAAEAADAARRAEEEARAAAERAETERRRAIELELAAKAAREAHARGVTAFERGVALQREGKLPGAIASYRQAIEFDASIAGAWTNLAILLDEVGQHAEAVDAARMAVALPATAEPARRAHAMHVLGHAQLGAGRGPEAIESLEQALAADPAHEPAALALANAWLAEGKPDRAADALAAARAAGADDAAIESFLAMLRWQQGRMDEAAAHANAALKMDPANLEASIALSYAQLGLKQWKEAAAGLEAALKRRPDDANLHAALGYAYDKLGRRGNAVDEFDRAIALEPAHPTAHAHRGASLEASGDVAKALEAFRKAEASAPVHSRSAVQTKLAVSSFQAGDMEQARAMARRAIETDPTNAHARFVLGMASLRLGDRAAAEAQRKALDGKDPERAAELAKAINEGAG